MAIIKLTGIIIINTPHHTRRERLLTRDALKSTPELADKILQAQKTNANELLHSYPNLKVEIIDNSGSKDDLHEKIKKLIPTLQSTTMPLRS